MSDFLEELGHSAEMPWGEVYHTKWMKEEFRKWSRTMEKVKWIEKVRNYVRKNILRYDINALLKSEGLIFYLPKETRIAGSFGEATLAYYIKRWTSSKNYKGKKIFVITDERLEDLSYWVIGCSDEIFFGFEEFKSYFKKNFNRKLRRRKRIA